MAKMTQVERMLRHMTDYKRLGYRVHTEMQTGKNRYGEPTRYALYRLEDAM